jgi:hypothetical protein
MPTVPTTVAEPWRRFLRLRTPIELALWAVAFLVPAAFNSVVTWLDIQRAGQELEPWKPVLWEASSAVMWLLLAPAMIALCERWPLHADTWRRRLPGYLLASIAFSMLHVAGMVLMRKAGYLALGDHYGPDSLPRMFGYEYLKDVRTFALVVLASHVYRWFWRRLQGEARLLDPPDDLPAVSAPERPERFLVRKLGREFLVAAADIEWMQASGNYVNLRVRGHDYPLRSTMAAIEAQLDPARFARIHRSHIVNLDQVASIEPLDTGDARVHMKDGSVLPCSRRQRDALRGRAAC